MLWRRAAARRPRDLTGIGDGIDREATMALYKGKGMKLTALERGYLRVIITGGVWTGDRLHRIQILQTGACAFCESGEMECERHMWWKCKA